MSEVTSGADAADASVTSEDVRNVDVMQLFQLVQCPITLSIMRDPVILVGDGQTYDKAAIEKHLTIQRTSPLTGQRLETPEDRRILTNWTVRNILNDVLKQPCENATAPSGNHIAMMTRAKALLSNQPKLLEELQNASTWCGTLGAFQRNDPDANDGALTSRQIEALKGYIVSFVFDRMCVNVRTIQSEVSFFFRMFHYDTFCTVRSGMILGTHLNRHWVDYVSAPTGHKHKMRRQIALCAEELWHFPETIDLTA